MKKSKSKGRRSPCPVACTLDIIGDRWTLLVIRDLMLGRSRFKEFLASPEQIPTNLLSERLNRLQAAGIIEQCESADGTKYQSYKLTASGEDLKTILSATRDWGLRWQKGTKIAMSKSH